MRRLLPLAVAALVAASSLAQAPPDADPNPAAAPPPPTPPPAGPREGVKARRVPGSVARQAEQGTKALLDQRPAEAMVRYDQAQVKAPDVAELAYNRGLAALMAGKADEARQSFELAQKLREEQAKADPKAAPPELLAEDSRFNDGHAAWQGDDLKGAVERWASVVEHDGDAGDARKNLELALRLLEVQQQQQQQQQQDQQQQDQQQQDQQDQPQPQQPDQGEDQEQQQQPQEPQDQPQQPEERAGEMSREQAEQLLEALEAAEKQSMEEKQEEKARRAGSGGGKIW